MSKIEEKKIHYEILRVIACFFVIFNHTQANGYDLFTQCSFSNPIIWLYMSISIACKVAVPIFFMVSGALLLKKEENLITLYKKRVLRFFCILVVFSFFYYIVDIALHNETAFDLKRFFLTLYESYWNYSFWFLYAYLAFLICLPVLRPLARGLSVNDYRYLIVLVFIFRAVLPVLEFLIWKGEHTLNSRFSVSWLGDAIVIYPLLGYFCEYKTEHIQKKQILALWGLSLMLVAVSCYTTYVKAQMDGYMNDDVSQTFLGSFVLVYSATLFLSVKLLCERIEMSNAIKRICLSISSSTFGIYLFHILILSKNPWFEKVWDFLHLSLHLNTMLSAFVGVTLIMIIGYVMTVLCKKIPIVKKLF